ncbi:MAG: DNA polymerase III subunit beta [Gammaproteobacteria bacterium RIFCSPHIGHO2_12_FULL_41_20]|nr:MAG: DNA polymerase III subunit beta [Gammaproteobacteria bacterium RIFCSPHIGHO2_12_FULL_41_20]
MDIMVKRSTLLKPLQAISGIVEKKQTIPILANVFLNAQEKSLSLTATDLEVELIGSVSPETVMAQGRTTVSGKKLFDICRVLPEEALLHLTIDGNYLIIRAGESCFSLATLPVKDFPRIEEASFISEFSIRAQALKDLLGRVYFAMGLQDIRHYLNGALLHINQKSITCVATDGHRLALSSLPNDKADTPQIKVILPRKSVLELMRLVNMSTDNDRELFLSIGDGRLRMVAPDFVFTTKLINTQYPDYNKLIPRGTEVATGGREVIRQALMRAAILSNDKLRGVRMRLGPNKLQVMANNMEQEQAEETVSLDYAGNEMEVGFNVTYLIDAFSSISSENVRCTFSDPDGGVLIESLDDIASMYVVMPMRL